MTPDERFDFFSVMVLFGAFDPESDQPFGGAIPKIPHNEIWLKVRRSFFRSIEWKTFRFAYLRQNSICNRCGQIATVVHHKPPYTLDSTVIQEGFLGPLKFTDRFEALCKECHYREHMALIESEQSKKHINEQDLYENERFVQKSAAFTPSGQLKLVSKERTKRTVKHICTHCPSCGKFVLDKIIRKWKEQGKVHYILECRKCKHQFQYFRH